MLLELITNQESHISPKFSFLTDLLVLLQDLLPPLLQSLLHLLSEHSWLFAYLIAFQILDTIFKNIIKSVDQIIYDLSKILAIQYNSAEKKSLSGMYPKTPICWVPINTNYFYDVQTIYVYVL